VKLLALDQRERFLGCRDGRSTQLPQVAQGLIPRRRRRTAGDFNNYQGVTQHLVGE
jgi:hypothetical protein